MTHRDKETFELVMAALLIIAITIWYVSTLPAPSVVRGF